MGFPSLGRGFDSPYPLQANLAQLVEQCFRKAEVPGSNPGVGSIKKPPSSDGGFLFIALGLQKYLHSERHPREILSTL